MYKRQHESDLEQTRLVSKLLGSGADDFEIESVIMIEKLVSRTAAQRGTSVEAARQIVISYLGVNQNE